MFVRNMRSVMTVLVAFIAAMGFFAGSPSVSALRSSSASPAPSPGDKKTFSEYKGVAIGTTADDVRKKLGQPKDKSDAQDLYTFSDSESAVFYYDPAHLVAAIMINYLGNLKDAPSVKDVFGEDVPPKPDGSVFKMVRYPKAGYSISYNRSGGDDALISLAIQKM